MVRISSARGNARHRLMHVATRLLRQGLTPKFCAATADGITTVQTYVSAAAKTLSTTQLMKGKSPQGSRVTAQIEQYFLCSAVQLTSCSSPAATASRLTSSMLPQVSLPTVEACVDNTAKLRPQASVLALRAVGASQLLKPASTTPRSYGRRYRSLHHGHVHATHNERRRVQRPIHHDQVHAWRRGIGLGTTIKHLRCTTSAAANNGLSTTIIPQRGTFLGPSFTIRISKSRLWAKRSIM
jgi:hypothetical protein